MEVQKEAQRIMTMSVWKMYHSRMQRGGLRLHRSLQLSLVMRNARDLYLSAKLEEEDEMGGGGDGAAAEDFPGREPQLDVQGEAPCPQYLEAPPPPTPFPQGPPAVTAEEAPPAALRGASPDPEPMETQEGPGSGGDDDTATPAQPSSPTTTTAWSRTTPRPPGAAAKPSRKRRSSSLGKIGAAEAGLVPSKKAKLVEEEESERQPQRQEGPFPSLARVLQDRFSGLILPPLAKGGGDEPKASCRQGDGVLSIMVRAVVAF